MPKYPGAVHGTSVVTTPPKPVALSPGEQFAVFNNESRASGDSSQAVALGPVGQGGQQTLTVEGNFDGDPGGFEIDLQLADTDADAFYKPNTTTITALLDATANSFRAEFTGVAGNFARVFLKTLTNAVKTTARIGRKG